MKKAMPFIALILVLVTCCLPLLLFVGFGYLQFGDSCVWKGPYSDPTGACDNDSSQEIEVDENSSLYETATYRFVYPNTFVVDDLDTAVTVTPTDSEEESLSVLNQQFSDDLVINEEYCNNYTQNFVEQLGSVGYSDVVVTESEFTTLNSYPACFISYNGQYNDMAIYQKQYLFDDPTVAANTFYLTVTVTSEENLSMFDSVIDSFQIL